MREVMVKGKQNSTALRLKFPRLGRNKGQPLPRSDPARKIEMTLTRLVTWLVLLFALLGSVVIVAVQWDATRNSIQDTLTRRSVQQAAWLAHSVPPLLAVGDTQTLNALVRAMVESGVAQRLHIESESGDTLFAAEVPPAFGIAPPWFAAMLRLPLDGVAATRPLATASLSSLHVRAQVDDVYSAAWDALMRMLAAYWAGVLLIWLAALLLMRGLRTDLERTERQLVAAAHGRFALLEAIPRFDDVQPLVAAGNTLVHKLGRMLEEANELADRLRREAYSDPVTGLATRRALELHLESARSDPESSANGALILVRLGNLREYNERFGIEAGDALLRKIGESAAQLCRAIPNSLCARLAGVDIAVFLPSADRAIAEQQAGTLAERLASSRTPEGGAIQTSLGVAIYSHKFDLPQLVKAADAAVRHCRDTRTNGWAVESVSDQTSNRWDYPDAHWRVLLEAALADKQLTLVQQPVVAASEPRIVHYELFVRIKDPDGEMIPAGIFMPVADRLGLAQLLDRAVLEMVMEALERRGDARVQYAVNVSCASIVDPNFAEWLCQALLVAPQVASSLIIEISERGLSSHLDPIRRLVQRLRALGASVSLDHFGMGYATVGYLRGLSVDCIKLDSGYTRGIDQETDHRNTARTLVDIGRGLRVKVYAQCIETEAEWATFKACDVDGGSGFLLGATEPFTP